MSILSLLTFLPSILTGILIIHLVWIDRNNPVELALKVFLGAGLGFGISSLSYFTYMVFFAGFSFYVYVELALFFAVLAFAYSKYKKARFKLSPQRSINFLQLVLLISAGVVSILSLLGVATYTSRRAYGDWDAWMIYNRAARFIYLGQENWRDAFSKDMYVRFHADYPPLLALNIASRWDILGKETTYVPMFQGFLFSLAALGICFGALASLKSLGQASLGLIFISGVSFFLQEGGRQQADVPLASYILASIVFLFFYYQEKRPILIAFSGLMAGLAAWTKNEGILFLFGSGSVITVAMLWKRSFRDLLFYFGGLFLPAILLLYFKLGIARPNEFISGRGIEITQYLFDISRHQKVVNAFIAFFEYSGGWYNIGIFLILCVYFILFHSRFKDNRDMIFISLAIFACQIMGYYFIYVTTPNDVDWQLNYSLNRLFVQIYPAVVFAVLATSQIPEAIFSPETK
jgi:hypothetical protein